MDERSGTVRVDGVELYYEAAGEGRPLVLLHDGLLDRRVWDDHFEAFAQRYRVVRYDRRGYSLEASEDLHDLLGCQGARG